MKSYVTNRAAEVGDIKVESAQLVARCAPPEFKTIKEYEDYFDRQASVVLSFILNHLPQGVTDRVLGLLMLEKSSTLIVPMKAKANAEEKCLFSFDINYEIWVTSCGGNEEIQTNENIRRLWVRCPYCGRPIEWDQENLDPDYPDLVTDNGAEND
jgi:hypothetical protein